MNTVWGDVVMGLHSELPLGRRGGSTFEIFEFPFWQHELVIDDLVRPVKKLLLELDQDPKKPPMEPLGDDNFIAKVVACWVKYAERLGCKDIDSESSGLLLDNEGLVYEFATQEFRQVTSKPAPPLWLLLL